MKAMVFAAGYGSRLGELTKNIPKCLVEAGGKTMLQHVLERLARGGVTDVVINLYHLGDKIKLHLKEHENFGLNITLSEEANLLGTGGGLKNVEEYFKGEESFIVHNSDVYSDLDIADLVKFHRENKPLATLAMMDRETDRYLLFDEKNNLSGWENVREGTGETFGGATAMTSLAFSGIQILSNEIFNYFREDTGQFSTMRGFMRAAREGQKIMAYRMDKFYWIDMGTPERLSELQALLTPAVKLQ